ncbi:MAG: hypothetical protein EXR69_10820 [Myxococcales bacterium]|nr:hypothetical protein [Myxococcales bacterium]
MNGSHLFAAGRHASEAEGVRAFLSITAPASLEIGFDHGMCLLDRARLWPETLQLGIEIREARVAALPSLPSNCRAWRADARAALATVIPPGRISTIYVLFPDPIWNDTVRARRLLFSPAFVALCARALTPTGCLHLATDIKAYFEWAGRLLSAWQPTALPELGRELSRRERVCSRDGINIHRGTWQRPACP